MHSAEETTHGHAGAMALVPAVPRRSITRPGNDSERRRSTGSRDARQESVASACFRSGQYSCRSGLTTSSFSWLRGGSFGGTDITPGAPRYLDPVIVEYCPAAHV